MRTNMLLLIFAFLHRNKLFHIKTNLCNGSQIIMRKSFVHEFSTWTYGILLFKKEVALKVFIWERKQRHSIKTRTFARPLVCTHHGHGWVKKILPELYHNSTLCSLILEVKPTLSFGPLIICGTFVGFSLGQRLIGKMHFRKALIAS